MTADIMPNHGITGLSITQDEVDLFLDYLVVTDPVPGKVHEKSQEAENTDLRDVDVRYIDAKQDRLYRILNRVAVSANKYFRYDISGIETAQILHYKAPSNGYGYHIDIGPEGGDKGGHVVFEGKPEDLLKAKNSYTGQFLKAHLK